VFLEVRDIFAEFRKQVAPQSVPNQKMQCNYLLGYVNGTIMVESSCVAFICVGVAQSDMVDLAGGLSWFENEITFIFVTRNSIL
jgi:hypothetical protein